MSGSVSISSVNSYIVISITVNGEVVMRICICGKGTIEVILKPHQLELFDILVKQHRLIGETITKGHYATKKYNEISLEKLNKVLDLHEGTSSIADRSIKYFKIPHDSYDKSLCCVDISLGIVIIVNERNTKTWIPSYSINIKNKSIELPSFGEIHVVGVIHEDYLTANYISELFITRSVNDFFVTLIPKHVKSNRRNPIANAVELFEANVGMMTVMAKLFEAYCVLIQNLNGDYSFEFLRFNKTKVIELMYRYDIANGLTGFSPTFAYTPEPKFVNEKADQLMKIQSLVLGGVKLSPEVAKYYDRIRYLIIALHRCY